MFGLRVPQHGVRNEIKLIEHSSRKIEIKLVMASSSGQGVAEVTLPTFSTSEDPRRNFEIFIQMFKDW